MADLT